MVSLLRNAPDKPDEPERFNNKRALLNIRWTRDYRFRSSVQTTRRTWRPQLQWKPYCCMAELTRPCCFFRWHARLRRRTENSDTKS